MSILSGTRLGRYEIRSKIGEGGMGEVYLAQDTKLGREVAVKVLPDAFASDPERLARFEREARLLASLNHPRIGAIHGLEEAGEVRFLVLELVRGETLAERLSAGALPTEDALSIAHQIAEALEAAHERGVVHRDLKPANVKITDDGQVKVLDFGLAKALEAQTAAANPSDSPTMLHQGTQAGIIIGTAPYMSPEQAKGRHVDKRSDIFSFGCVLYELLAGKQAFSGESASDTLASVIRGEPDWSLLPAGTTRKIRDLLKRCLQKDLKRRLHDIADARIEIEEALVEPQDATTTTASLTTNREVWRRAIPLALAGLLLGAAIAGFVFWSLTSSGSHARTNGHLAGRLIIRLPENEPLALTKSAPQAIGRVALAISPDGTNIVYVGNHNGAAQLYLRPLDQFDAKRIYGTEGAFNPFFSPDGQWIGFFTGNKLMKVALAGGEPVFLCEARNPDGASWSANDTILFGDMEGGTLKSISASGGTPKRLGVGSPVQGVSFLPDGKWAVGSTSNSNNPDYNKIVIGSLDTEEGKSLLEGGTSPRSIPGYLLFARTGSLMAVPFDAEKGKITGPATTVIESVRSEPYGDAQYDVSQNGTLIYVTGSAGWIGKPVWVDRQGKVTPTGMPIQSYGTFRLSPDGKRLAITVAGATDDVWVYEFARGTFARLTVAGNNFSPIWTRDGKKVTFVSCKDGQCRILQKPYDASGSEDVLTTSQYGIGADSWSPNGKVLAYTEWNPNTSGDIFVLQLDGDRKPQPFLRTQFTEWGPAFSPDGHWIAYTSDESGRYEVYVRPFPDTGGKWQISTEGGEEPVWAHDGKEIFYRNGEKWMAASVRIGSAFSAETPHLLFESYFINVPGLSHDVVPDGARQMMIQPNAQDNNPRQLNVVVNWLEELKRRVPAGK